MVVADTKLATLEKCCSTCQKLKSETCFIKKRNICKECRNAKTKAIYNSAKTNENTQQKCNVCENSKSVSCFIKNRKICKDCNNDKRKNKYKTDETHRKKLIMMATIHKYTKIVEKQKKQELLIGYNNKKCNGCFQIKVKEDFRHNRLTCKNCERDNVIEKFKKTVRSRICSAITKSKHTIEYLGCNSSEYLKWLLNNDEGYTLENRGRKWHIDHVIPLAHFDLTNESHQLIAFNWRNTMPLDATKNLIKNKKIILSQVEQHYKKLVEYHTKNNIELPFEFIDLFAKYLVAGNPLESLPTTCP